MLVHVLSLLFLGDILYHLLKTEYSIFTWHPLMMTLGFAFFMMEAIMVFRGNSLVPQWNAYRKRQFHWVMQLLAVAAAFVGVACIWTSKNMKGKPHFQSWHGLIGIITFVYACTQCLAGANLLYPRFVSKMIPVNKLRRLHAISGAFLFGLGALSLSLGMCSSWFTSVAHPYVWYASIACPTLLALMVAKQVFMPPRRRE